MRSSRNTALSSSLKRRTPEVNPQIEAGVDAPGDVHAGLAVDSVTGVDVSLHVAGPGARAYAFVIDWHIRVVLAIAWYVLGVLLYNGRWDLSPPDEPHATWFIFIGIPAGAIYFLYPCVMELVMRGRTPGKRMVGVRLVTHDGSVPAASAILLRNVFRLIDSFPAFYGVGLVTSVVTRTHVRIGDLAAGTLLVYVGDDRSVLEFVSPQALGTHLDGPTADIVNDLLRRWDVLEAGARARLARKVLAGTADADWSAASDRELREQLERLARGGPP
jgi:uncharacterized RDD family membrane protein YckC